MLLSRSESTKRCRNGFLPVLALGTGRIEPVSIRNNTIMKQIRLSHSLKRSCALITVFTLLFQMILPLLSTGLSAAFAAESGEDGSAGSANYYQQELWIKEVDLNANAVWRWWARGELKAQAKGLKRLGDMAPDFSYTNGQLRIAHLEPFGGGSFEAWKVSLKVNKSLKGSILTSSLGP